MSKDTYPGFSADASLYRACRPYSVAATTVALTSGLVMPQLVSVPGGIYHCFQTCIGGWCDSGYCCSEAGCKPIAFSNF